MIHRTKEELISGSDEKSDFELRKERETSVPFVIEPGFKSHDGNFGSGRFLLALGTTTITSFSTSTYTAILTATCASTTGFAVTRTETRQNIFGLILIVSSLFISSRALEIPENSLTFFHV